MIQIFLQQIGANVIVCNVPRIDEVGGLFKFNSDGLQVVIVERPPGQFQSVVQSCGIAAGWSYILVTVAVKNAKVVPRNILHAIANLTREI